MMRIPPTTSAIVLAGGASRRLGSDKRRLRLWGDSGPTLLEHILSLVQPLCAERIVVLNDPQDWRGLSARLIPDETPGAGPLGGLVSGMAVMTTDQALVVACDLPLLAPALLSALLETPFVSDALVVEGPYGELEPLLAIYRSACLPAARGCLERGQRSMHALLDALQVQISPRTEWHRFDPTGQSFLNLNRPEDLELVRTILARPTE